MRVQFVALECSKPVSDVCLLYIRMEVMRQRHTQTQQTAYTCHFFHLDLCEWHFLLFAYSNKFIKFHLLIGSRLRARRRKPIKTFRNAIRAAVLLALSLFILFFWIVYFIGPVCEINIPSFPWNFDVTIRNLLPAVMPLVSKLFLSLCVRRSGRRTYARVLNGRWWQWLWLYVRELHTFYCASHWIYFHPQRSTRFCHLENRKF